jgi:hypothetical protein
MRPNFAKSRRKIVDKTMILHTRYYITSFNLGTDTAGISLLGRRASHVAIGAKNTAIPGLGLQQFSTALAVIKILTGVGRHDLPLAMLTVRTVQCGFENRHGLVHLCGWIAGVGDRLGDRNPIGLGVIK